MIMKPQYKSDEGKQLEVCKKVIRDISWMAQRYASGRQTYAPSMFNDAIKLLDANNLGDLHKEDPMSKERFAK